MEKKVESGHDILYLLQDMREFELYGTVRAVISACDSVNYITDDEDLTEVFRLVNNYLDPEGLFVFDFNTEYKYREILGEQTIAEDREECSFIWDNYYDEDERINEYELTLFVRDEEQPQLYRKYQEEHFQRAYTLEQIRHMLTEAGLEYVTAYDDYTKEVHMTGVRESASWQENMGKDWHKIDDGRLYCKSGRQQEADACICCDNEKPCRVCKSAS